jgi:hypothetical protein
LEPVACKGNFHTFRSYFEESVRTGRETSLLDAQGSWLQQIERKHHDPGAPPGHPLVRRAHWPGNQEAKETDVPFHLSLWLTQTTGSQNANRACLG